MQVKWIFDVDVHFRIVKEKSKSHILDPPAHGLAASCSYWASKLYLSKKELTTTRGSWSCTALERPIIKSGPPAGRGIVIPTNYFLSLLFYCSSQQLSLFQTRFETLPFIILYSWSCSSTPFLSLFFLRLRPLQHHSSSLTLILSLHKQPWHGPWVLDKLWNGVSAKKKQLTLVKIINVVATYRNGWYPERDEKRYWYHPSRTHGEWEREFGRRYEQTPLFCRRVH